MQRDACFRELHSKLIALRWFTYKCHPYIHTQTLTIRMGEQGKEDETGTGRNSPARRDAVQIVQVLGTQSRPVMQFNIRDSICLGGERERESEDGGESA